MTDILAAMKAFMDRFPPQPRRELYCGEAVWDVLRELKPADTGPLGLGAALGGVPLYGIPVHVDQTMRAGWWELREDGEVTKSGDITPVGASPLYVPGLGFVVFKAKEGFEL
jgi:hypothetical protein